MSGGLDRDKQRAFTPLLGRLRFYVAALSFMRETDIAITATAGSL